MSQPSLMMSWLLELVRSLSPWKGSFNQLDHESFDKWYKMQIYFHINKFIRTRVKFSTLQFQIQTVGQPLPQLFGSPPPPPPPPPHTHTHTHTHTVTVIQVLHHDWEFEKFAQNSNFRISLKQYTWHIFIPWVICVVNFIWIDTKWKKIWGTKSTLMILEITNQNHKFKNFPKIEIWIKWSLWVWSSINKW